MNAKYGVDPGIEIGDEVAVTWQPTRAPRETVEGTLGASVGPDGKPDAIIVSGDGWAVHMPVHSQVLSVRRVS